MARRVLTQFKQRLSGLELVPAGGGCFEIELDGDLVYSKLAVGAFPDEDAIIDMIAKRL